MIKKILSSALLAAAASMSVAANAAYTTYFGEDLGLGEAKFLNSRPNSNAANASFLSRLTNPGVANFENFADNTANPSINFGSAGITATLSGGSVASTANGTTNGVGRYGISGDPDGNGRDSYYETSSALTLTFSSPVGAFGFYGIDIGDFNGQVTVTTVGGLSKLFNVGNTLNGAGGGVLFWGLISDTATFTSISFGNTASGTDFFGFDNFTIGSLTQITPTTVPEPSTFILMLAALHFFRKRKI